MEKKFEQELFEFLRIPSVSAQSQHRSDCLKAAQFVQKSLASRGFASEVRESGKPDESFPVVVGKWEPPGANRDTPTLLVYGHYDVQPPEPLELWTTPAFEPTVRDGKVYARGATDNKGQIFALICGLGEALKRQGTLPLRVLFLVEGEEEIGSPSLASFIQKHQNEFSCQVVLVSDSPQLGPGQPAICYGLKGLTYFELHVKGPRRDLHSGSFGGLVQNPAIALCKMLASISDDQGQVLIEGFEDDIVPLSQEERDLIAALPYDEQAALKDLGVKEFFGDPAFTPLERRFARPTHDIHGLSGGYQGEGAKTVIPSLASAKFGFRLVANQTPEKTEKLLRRHLEKNTPAGITWRLESFHPSAPVLVDRKHVLMKAAQAAIRKSFGKDPVFIREGGSIPVVSIFQHELKALPILIGLGLPTDGAHAPDEHMTLADFHRGIEMATCFPEFLAQHFSS